jgi:hypothetical protein
MRFDVDEPRDVVMSRMNGQTEAMLFEPPTEVRRDADVKRAPVRTRKDVDDGPTSMTALTISCEGCLDQARSLRSALRASVETTAILK